jgi:hypothetical protein
MARRKCFLKSLKFLAEDRLSQRQHLFFISWQRTPSNEEDKKGKEEKKRFHLKRTFSLERELGWECPQKQPRYPSKRKEEKSLPK